MRQTERQTEPAAPPSRHLRSLPLPSRPQSTQAHQRLTMRQTERQTEPAAPPSRPLRSLPLARNPAASLRSIASP